MERENLYPVVNVKDRKDCNVRDAIGDTVSDRALKFVKRKHKGAIKLLEDD